MLHYAVALYHFLAWDLKWNVLTAISCISQRSNPLWIAESLLQCQLLLLHAAPAAVKFSCFTSCLLSTSLCWSPLLEWFWHFHCSLGNRRCDAAHQQKPAGAGATPDVAETVCSADPKCAGLYDEGCNGWCLDCDSGVWVPTLQLQSLQKANARWKGWKGWKGQSDIRLLVFGERFCSKSWLVPTPSVNKFLHSAYLETKNITGQTGCRLRVPDEVSSLAFQKGFQSIQCQFRGNLVTRGIQRSHDCLPNASPALRLTICLVLSFRWKSCRLPVESRSKLTRWIGRHFIVQWGTKWLILQRSAFLCAYLCWVLFQRQFYYI